MASKARNIADLLDSNGDVQAAALDTQPQLGRRNLIINGAMQVAQRGTSATGVSAFNGYKTLDRFITESSGDNGAYTLSQSTDAPLGFDKSYRVETTTANTADSYWLVGQKIEAPSLRHLKYGTPYPESLTLSFWVKSSETGDVSIEFLNRATGGSDRSIGRYITISSADTWEKHSVTIEGDSVGSFVEDNSNLFVIFFGSAQTGFYSGSFNQQWQTRNTSQICTSNNIDVLGGVGRYLEITGIQLELGSVATPFEHRSYGEELALCQRYFQKTYDKDVYAGTATVSGCVGGRNYSSAQKGNNALTVRFPVTMRTTPTATVYSLNGTVDNVSNTGAGGQTHDANVAFSDFNNSLNENGFATVDSGTVSADDFFNFHYLMDAEL